MPEMHAQTTTVSGFRLSPQQRRIWRSYTAGFDVHARSAIALDGELDTDLLRSAVMRLVGENEALTSSFKRVPGIEVPFQAPTGATEPAWHEADLSGYGETEQTDRLAALYADDAAARLDVESGSSTRFVLVRLTPRAHVLLVQSSALCADAWSLNRLTTRLALHYDALRAGRHIEPPEIGYIQFAEWHNGLLDDEDAEQGAAFWRNRAATRPPRTTLPYEVERTDDYHTLRSVSLPADSQLLAQIEACLERSGTTLETFLLACWVSLLWRLSGDAKIAVGVSHHGRDHEEFHDIVGPFSRYLPITVNLGSTLPFSALLRHLAQSADEARNWHEYLPWDTTDLDADVPYHRVGFTHRERPIEARGGELVMRTQDLHVCSEPFDLALTCTPGPGGLTLVLDYRAKLFEQRDVEQLAAQLSTLIEAVLTDLDVPIRALPVVDSAQRRRMLDFNERPAAPRSVNLVELFEQQAARTPDRTAIVFGNDHLSFEALRSRTSQLAHYLRKLGAGPESVVALCVDRSLDLLVGMLGILKAGSAYLPIEPLPRERAGRMLADAGAQILLSSENLADYLPKFAGTTICIDRDWAQIAIESTRTLAIDILPEQLAYIIYTSGSTGNPKGVMIEHRCVVNLLGALQRDVYTALEPATSLRVGVNAPVVFDASVKQIVQLFAGHTLCILPDEVRPDSDRLLAFAETHQLDVLDATPTQIRGPRVDDGDGRRPRWPRLVLLGGEPIESKTWQWLAAQPGTRFYNVYGPTECTVDSSVWPIDAQHEPSIGRPVANAQVYVLDREYELTPLRLAGELHIAGAGLARGYFNDPVRTAERFAPNPFTDQPGMRMYRTGDLGSFDTDGTLSFMGRSDHQVKLRGYRIELGEIEAVLTEHSAVTQSVAIVREDSPGDSRLVAYYVGSEHTTAPLSELREHLRSRLPEYMVPSALVPLKKLPMTRNGKIDRKGLPVPESARPELQSIYVAPTSDAEQKIAAIWRDVLHVDKVGIQDNFFDLGGHSLLMVQAHTKLRAAFDKELPLVEMFRNPTVQALAAYFTQEQPSHASSLDRAQQRAEQRQRARRRHAARSSANMQQR